MSCLYCDPRTFPNQGISIKSEKVEGRTGKWHKRVDGRFVKCVGKKNTQSFVELTLENAVVLQDQFTRLVVIAKCKNGGTYIASDTGAGQFDGHNTQSYLLEYAQMVGTFLSGLVPRTKWDPPSSPLDKEK